MPLTLSPMTELEAVNEILRASGDSPVLTLAAPLRMEVSVARDILTSTCRRFQSQGWNFNTEYAYPLPLTSDGEILVPTNVLEIDINATHSDMDVVRRGSRLYDRGNKTYTFTQAYTFDITWLLPFDEMPETARDYVAVLAGKRFQAGTVGSETLHKFTSEDEEAARLAFLRADLAAEDCNMLTGSYHVYNIVKRTPGDAGI